MESLPQVDIHGIIFMAGLSKKASFSGAWRSRGFLRHDCIMDRLMAMDFMDRPCESGQSLSEAGFLPPCARQICLARNLLKIFSIISFRGCKDEAV